MSVSDIEKAVSLAADQRYKQLTRQQLIRSLVRPFDRFDVHAAKYVNNDGSEKALVKLDGILPVEYRGVQYNIPIMLWLSVDFPYEAPICFVRPVHNMVLNERCHVIDRNGRIVHLNTLIQWSHDRTTLTDVFRDMATQFGQSPPVFSKTSEYLQSQSILQQRPSIGFTNPAALMDGYSNGAILNKRTDEMMPTFSNQNPQGIPDHVLRSSLISALLDKAKRDFLSNIHILKSEIAIHKKSESDLLNGSNQLKLLIRTLSTEEDRLNGYIHTVNEKSTELENALTALKRQRSNLSAGNKTNSEDDGSLVDLVQRLFVPTTHLYAQIVQLYTEDAAIQDALFYLGEGQRRRTLSLSDYLRFVRKLGRKQFFIRATLLKAKKIAGI